LVFVVVQAEDPKDALEWISEIDECINKINAAINVGA
jgi:hypothetical protein